MEVLSKHGMNHPFFLEELMERIRNLVRKEARSSTPGAGASILSRNGISATDQILFRLRQQIPVEVSDIHAVRDTPEFTGLRVELKACISASETFGEVNPRPPGFLNDRLQSVKRLMRRSLGWYTRPLHMFHGAVIRTLQQFLTTLEKQEEMLSERAFQIDLLAAERRLDDVEQGTWQIYQVTQSAIENSEAQARVTNHALDALRADLSSLRRQVESITQQRKEPELHTDRWQ